MNTTPNAGLNASSNVAPDTRPNTTGSDSTSSHPLNVGHASPASMTRTGASDAGAQRILHPDGWARAIGYSNGVVVSGRHVVLAGQIGWNPVTATFESDDFTAQVRQALRNIVTLLAEADATPQHLVRLTWFVTDKAAYMSARREIGAAYREIIGAYYPPMSVVIVSALVEDRALVEIEATAVVPE